MGQQFETFITSSPAKASPAGTELVPIIDSGVTKHVLVSQLSGGSGGSSTIAGASDYDNTTPATDGQAIIWNAGESKFKPGTVSGGGGSYSGPAFPADTVPSSPTSYDDEFTGASLAGKWSDIAGTTRGSGVRTKVVHPGGSGWLEVVKQSSGAGYYGIEQACPSGAWQIDAAVIMEYAWGSYNSVNLIARPTTPGNVDHSNAIVAGVEGVSQQGNYAYANARIGLDPVLADSGFESRGATIVLSSGPRADSGGYQNVSPGGTRIYLRLAYDGTTNYNFWWSFTGFYDTSNPDATTTSGPSSPLTFGVCVGGFGNGSSPICINSRAFFDFFRKTA